jgi:hypothetical protein
MRRIVMFAAFVFLVPAAVPAQTSIYITSSSAHLSNVEAGELPSGSGYQEQYSSFWTSGVGGGVTLSFLPLGPVKLGFDFRGSTRPGTPGADTAMVGVKLGFSPPALRVKPYLQASGGYLASRSVNVANLGTFNNKYVGWEILGGIDYPLVKLLDVRMIELGGGTAVSLPGFGSGPSISLFTINAGLVLHF